MAFSVEIKHAGKQHKVEYNPVDDAKAFKESIYQVTGVPTDRMKVMVKGGILKDDADMSKIAIKEGQVITVIGTAGPLPQAPAKKLTFLEDMDDSDLASALKQPPGLTNLGNTCYMNASLQALRTIPELKTVLSTYRPDRGDVMVSSMSNGGTHSGVTSDLRNLFVGMDKTTEAIPPFAFLNSLRRVNPQFAEQSQHGGYAQQDADEMWTQTLSSLRHALPGGDANDSASGATSFIDNYLSADLEQVLTCDEAPEEPKSVKTDKVLKLDCNININTNYMLTGIKDSFDQKIEKNSPTLNRTAVYTQTSRLARLPANLTVHMVRFYWRADVQKKAKIMRKVKFPLELDVSELLTDELRDKFRPVNLALKNIDKARADRAKQRKKRKNNIVRASTPGSSSATPAGSSTLEPSTGDADVIEVEEQEKEVPEEEMREKERQQVKDLIKAQGGQGDAVEKGSNQTGLYELCAIVTHKGATADSGHYIGWTRQPTEENGVPGEEDWWKFDDDKVSVVPMTKIMALDGGGEDSTAYILLYRSKTV